MYRRFFGSTYRQVLCLFSVVACFLVALFYIPIRNLVFSRYIYKAWRDVSTQDLMHMHYIRPQYPPGVYAVIACDVKRLPAVKREDINSSGILVYKPEKNKQLIHTVLSNGHGRYLPVLNFENKLDYLYLYTTMKESLKSRNVVFFMTAGSILGAVRHAGFVPWDDDLDFGIHISQWEDVKQLLSCIKGFSLDIFAPLHWKFHFKDREFPFIDIFFYDKNGPYLWSMTHYISKTFIYPEHLVFPLVEVEFEGVRMPMPGEGLEIIKLIYDDYKQCVSYPGHIQRNRTTLEKYPQAYSKSRVPCGDLEYLYPMKNLHHHLPTTARGA